MTLNDTRVLVIGGGFSGLSAAIMLNRAGCTVDLVERNAHWMMDGAGISIGGATLRALHTLGVLDRFFADGCGCDGTDVRTRTGELITQFPTPRLVGPDIPGNGAIMRPLLGRILADAGIASGARMLLGTTVDELQDTGTEVEVAFSDGSAQTYDLVVGADGIYSSTRQRILPNAPSPSFSGQGAWRAVVARPSEIERTTIWVGADTKVGVNPISASEMYLFVNENTSVRDRVPDDELLPRLRALVEPFPDPLLQDIHASLGDDSLVLYRPMDNLLVPLPWHRGRVVLIGDAVHATTPHLGQGGGMAIEDAVVLAEELAGQGDADATFTAYRRRRFDRCRYVVEKSLEICRGQIGRGPLIDNAKAGAEMNALLAEPI